MWQRLGLSTWALSRSVLINPIFLGVHCVLRECCVLSFELGGATWPLRSPSCEEKWCMYFVCYSLRCKYLYGPTSLLPRDPHTHDAICSNNLYTWMTVIFRDFSTQWTLVYEESKTLFQLLGFFPKAQWHSYIITCHNDICYISYLRKL